MRENKEKGIILLEAIIAVGVLVTVFTAAIAMYMSSVKGVRLTNDLVIATFLAQDAMEAVIAKRQLNYDYSHDPAITWLSGMSHCTAGNPCKVDFDHDPENPFLGCGGSCPLYIDSGVYNISSGDPSIYSRSVELNTVNTYTTRAIVRVRWMDGSNQHEHSLVTVLYDNPN